MKPFHDTGMGAQSLRNHHVAECIAVGRPVGPVYRMVKLDNRWTLFHRMSRWPDRLLCVGDTVCALNPLYGQGMTLAAIHATVLRDLLDGHRGAQPTGLARTFQRRAARATLVPWLMSTSSDQAWDPEHSTLFTRAATWYVSKLVGLFPGNSDVYRRFWLAAQMVKGPAVLLAPGVLGHLAISLVRRQGVSGRQAENRRGTARALRESR